MGPRGRRPRVAPALAALAALITARTAAAAPTRIDDMEHIFGASNTNAVAGFGGLTVGVGADGDVTVLSWPSPSYYDQLAYIGGNDLDVRDEPHLGALDGMGSYVGLLVDRGNGPALTFLRDAAWSRHQGYTQDDAPIPITTFHRADLGLTVTLTDVVSPDADVLTRRVQVTRAAGSPVKSVSLAVYENLSPTLSQVAEAPICDWALDPKNDFLALYDARNKAIIHFHPGDAGVINSYLGIISDPTKTDFGPVEALMTENPPRDADVDALIQSLDQKYKPGVAALVTTEPAPSSFQVGDDATSLCAATAKLVANVDALPTELPGDTLPVDPSELNILECTDSLPVVQKARGWTWQPEDALADLADGKLSGSRVAVDQTNGALIAPLEFSGNQAEGDVDFAFGSTLAAARAALSKARAEPPASRESDAEAAADSALFAIKLPDPSLGENVVRIAERAIVNLFVARDRRTGAIVASISRQPPYHLDWPRDGAFLTAAMDVAGLAPWSVRRDKWYATLQRSKPAKPNTLLEPTPGPDPDTGAVVFPADAWEMNYFANGVPGGPIRFEIDNTGLHIWSVALTAASLPASERADFINAIWPSTKRALDLLTRWRDAKTGLQALASEDDHYEQTHDLQGAVAVYAALVAGARLAKAHGDSDDMNRYLARAAELKSAVFKYFYDAKAGLFHDTMTNMPAPDSGAVAWTIWPARLLAPGDPRLEPQLEADMNGAIDILGGQAEGGSYLGKNILSAALYGNQGGARDQAKQALGMLAAAATPDTLQFGETYVVVSKPGDPVMWSARVAPPHVWQGILFYLSAMALTDPKPFNLDQQVLPLPGETTATSTPPLLEARGGCGCRLTRPDGEGSAALLAVLGAVLCLERRRRGRSSA
jgi:glucoamylase